MATLNEWLKQEIRRYAKDAFDFVESNAIETASVCFAKANALLDVVYQINPEQYNTVYCEVRNWMETAEKKVIVY